MTAVLFTLALVVAALGIPGALDWFRYKTIRWQAVAEQSRRAPVDPRSLVPPSSPSGVVRPGPSLIPSLSALRAATQDDIEAMTDLSALRAATQDDIEAMTDAAVEAARAREARGGRNGGSGGRGGKVGGGRERPGKIGPGKIGPGRSDPPAPPPRSRLW